MTRSPLVLLVGPSPPPYNGMSVAAELIRKALDGIVPYTHLDTADRRGLSNIGRLDFTNVLLAFVHGAKCLWILLSERPTAVYVPISQAWLPFLRDCLFLIPARITGRKIIIHLHGGYFGRFYKQSSPAMQGIIRYCLGKSSVAIVLGESLSRVFDGVIPAERIRVVPNGIQDRFAVGSAGRNGTTQLLYLGALDAQKGVLDIIQALLQVRDKTGHFRVVFAGSWYSRSDRESAEKIIDRAGLANYVEFVGTVESKQKDSLLSASDVLLLPSKNEGQPYVVLEGMAASLPIISTKVGCIPATVRDGVDGFLVEVGDISALANRMELLIRDESLRKRMGQAARQRFLENYTYEQFSSRIREVFRDALAEA